MKINQKNYIGLNIDKIKYIYIYICCLEETNNKT